MRQAPTGWSVSNYLERLSAVWPGQLPFGVSVWSNLSAHTTERNAFSIAQAADTSNQRRAAFVWTDGKPATNDRDTASANATIAVTAPTSTWFHQAASWVSASLREAWLNGGNKASNTTTLSVGTPDTTWIGNRHGGTNIWDANGAIAEVSVWDLAGMDATDRDAWASKMSTLVNGAAPNPLVANAEVGQPWSGKLVAYIDLDVNSPTFGQDLTGNGHDFTEVGTLTAFADYPPVATERQAPTGWSVSNYLQRLAAVVTPTDYPFVTSFWTNDTEFGDTAFANGMDGGAAAQTYGWRFASGGVYNSGGVRARWIQSGHTAANALRSILSNSPAMPSGEWLHHCWEMVSASEIHHSFNGANRLSNTTAVVTQQGTPDVSRIGVNETVTNPWSSTGAIAEIAIFSAAGMSEAERLTLRDLLYAGNNPLALNAQSGQPWSGLLLAYVDLDINSATFGQDLSGNGHHYTEVGTLTAFADYPPVDVAPALTLSITNVTDGVDSTFTVGQTGIIITGLGFGSAP